MELIVKYENEMVKTCFKKKDKLLKKTKSKGDINEVVRDQIYEYHKKFDKYPSVIKMNMNTFVAMINETTTMTSLSMHDDGKMLLHGVRLHVA